MGKRVGILRETSAFEKRVAATPETVKKLISKGFSVAVERGAGLAAGLDDAAYAQAGAQLGEAAQVWAESEVLLKIHAPTAAEVPLVKPGTLVVGQFRPQENRAVIEALAKQGASSFCMEWVPRITRAQSMDILSSQANLLGYKAVLVAAEYYGGLFPMLMTAAGTVRAAKVLVLGAGVAGLQAIATAKRLGAIVSAFDIRQAAIEQVKSLGASFVELDLGVAGEGQGGYARELTQEERALQVAKLGEVIGGMDIVIATAAVPGRPAPKLISRAAVAGMKRGSVIVDLAAVGGGNCEACVPDETITTENGVTVVGDTRLINRLAPEASALFSRNTLNFLLNLFDSEGHPRIDLKDEIVAATLLTHEGKIVHPQLLAKA